MKKRGARIRPIGLHRAIAAGIHRAARQRKADVIARPMRELFSLLMSGEVCEIDGEPVMRMPEVDDAVSERAQWCAIAPAILGWIDVWRRLAPNLDLQHMSYLAERLDQGKTITPRLVEKARAEFEATIARIPDLPDGAILSAITTTQIGWEMEKLQERTA